jgi:outer membrane beta-barrel protein
VKKLLLLLVCSSSGAALAQSELENPGSVSAVQERTFKMAHELDLSLGMLPLDAFYKQIYGQVAYVYHFTDWLAWQVGRGAYGYNFSTGLRQQLERDFAVLPSSFEQVQWHVGSDIMFKPFYGKAAWLNRAVLHFEVYVLGGATLFKFDRALNPAVNVGGGVRFFINKYVSWRFDVTNNIVIRDKPFSILSVQLLLGINFGASE